MHQPPDVHNDPDVPDGQAATVATDMKLPFRASISFALGTGLLLIFLSIVASYSTINFLIRDAGREAQTQQTVILLERLVSQFKTAESFQRRYLLTATASDLDDYRRARERIQQALMGVLSAQTLTRGGEDVRALERLVAERVSLMEQIVVMRQQSGLDAAIALVSSDRNRRLHDELNALFDQIKDHESQVIEHARLETRRTAQIVKLLIVAGGLVSLSVLAWAVWMILRAQAASRRIQAKLTDSEALSRAVTESMAEGVVTATQDGVIVSANSAARTLFGYRATNLLGQNVVMLLPPRYRSGFTAFFGTLAERPRGFREAGTQVRGQRHDSTEFPVNVSFGDVTVGGRRLFTAIIRDVTESKRISEALRASEAQLRQVTDTVPALIAYIDGDQRFQFHNKAYEEAFGLTAAQIHGKTMQEVLGPEFYAQVEGRVREVLAGYAVRYEREHYTAGGERRDYVMNYFPRYGEEEDENTVVGFFSLGNDVTELKRIDRMKSEFVSTVSHELRTPLTSIRGSLGLVSGGIAGELPNKAKSLVEIAKNNCERLIRLINDILDSEKIESGKMSFEPRPLELLPLLEQTLAANEGFAAQHGVTLVLQAGRMPVRVNADADRLVQVVTNLLSNAIKFSPAQGEVRVVLGCSGGSARVEISDQGPGIPDEFRKRIFQKFSQADSSDTRQRGGTGLGLSISRAIIERMDGSIGFAPAVPRGTTFFFALPEWREAPPVTAPVGLDGMDRPRVLVCEDAPDVASLIGMMLDRGGFAADLAHTAAQARDYLKMETYAAMTVDIQLPYENGLQLIAQLRQVKRTENLPVLVLSVSAAEARLHAGSPALGVWDWLEKPLDEKRLLDSLRQAIASRKTGGRGT
ncbi:PAS domain S-box protein [Polaromonas sp.]|uniref:PAS domain S-box protein n=1 Tax=Polaromonas sp. TaxID=1869339 RepID=UPI0025CCE93B|nr:PAS domain S-box protein [Polaromonas sp.]